MDEHQLQDGMVGQLTSMYAERLLQLAAARAELIHLRREVDELSATIERMQRASDTRLETKE